eukprot:6834430-Pyramimonas_sp.AAC.1
MNSTGFGDGARKLVTKRSTLGGVVRSTGHSLRICVGWVRKVRKCGTYTHGTCSNLDKCLSNTWILNGLMPCESTR